MKLYNSVIHSTLELLSAYKAKALQVDSKLCWEILEHNQLLLKKDSAYELGVTGKNSCTYTCCSSENIISKDEILLYGKDMKEISSDTAFARIDLLKISNIDEDSSYLKMKDLECIKYKVLPAGYMARVSTFDKREQVRVSKKAIKKGINFEAIGNCYIEEYKKNSLVEKVKIIFITEDLPIFDMLVANSKKVEEITFALNHVLKDMSFDCATCSLKEICDEVEGMKELHFKNKN